MVASTHYWHAATTRVIVIAFNDRCRPLHLYFVLDKHQSKFATTGASKHNSNEPYEPLADPTLSLHGIAGRLFSTRPANQWKTPYNLSEPNRIAYYPDWSRGCLGDLGYCNVIREVEASWHFLTSHLAVYPRSLGSIGSLSFRSALPRFRFITQ